MRAYSSHQQALVQIRAQLVACVFLRLTIIDKGRITQEELNWGYLEVWRHNDSIRQWRRVFRCKTGKCKHWFVKL
jgi:hypothetical protein